MSDVDVYECSRCDYRTTSKRAILSHEAGETLDQWLEWLGLR